MPKDMPLNINAPAHAHGSVDLPDAHFIVDATMARHGADLTLTAADGRHFTVEGYFAQEVPPDLVAPNGAKLTPQLIAAFTPPEHAGEYAANTTHTMTDASPAGRITAVSGEAHIVRADGTHVEAKPGTPIFQNDVIETGKDGAVNMLFADHTAFAVGESAKMSVDKYAYSDAEHTGSSFFSVLQGVFVYTSGLIGKGDPGAVSVETPVGTIGIRGTAFAGEIDPHHHSTISLWDGAGYVDNGAGETSFAKRFTAYTYTSYDSAPQLDTHFDPKQFMHDHKMFFGIVDAPWIGDLMKDLKIDGSHDQHQGKEGLLYQKDFPWNFFHSPAWDHGKEAAATTTTSGDAATAASSFDGWAHSFAGEAAASDWTSSDSSDTASGHGGALTAMGAIGGGSSTPVVYDLFPLSTSELWYYDANIALTAAGDSQLITHYTGTGIPEFFFNDAPVGLFVPDEAAMAAVMASIPGMDTYSGELHFSAMITDAQTGAILGSFNLAANSSFEFPDGSFPATIGPFTIGGLEGVDGVGGLFIADRMEMSHWLHPQGFNLTTSVTLDDGTVLSYGTNHLDIKDYNITGAAPTIITSDWSPTVASDNHYVVVDDNGLSGDIYIKTGTGFDVIIGGETNDIVTLRTDHPLFIDGMDGNNTLFFDTALTLDFTQLGDYAINNFGSINLQSTGATITLTPQAVFQLTSDGEEVLSISAGLFAGNNTINMPTSLFAALPDYVQTGSIGDGDVTFSATYNDTNITLVIHQGNSGDANHITVSTAG